MTALHIPVLDPIVRAMAQQRPVFHSEADLQHALAWLVHELDPAAAIRLETRPEPAVHLDLLITTGAGQRIAVEIKYPTAVLVTEVNGEQFTLRNHGAQDLTGYDCIKDLTRLERFTGAGYAQTGFLLVLTNDSYLWRPPKDPDRPTNAAAFRLYEGTVLTGPRAWGPNTGGTARRREDILNLQGQYQPAWQDYSTVPGRNGTFRYLLLEVPPVHEVGELDGLTLGEGLSR